MEDEKQIDAHTPQPNCRILPKEEAGAILKKIKKGEIKMTPVDSPKKEK